jgi:hypothetical protein
VIKAGLFWIAVTLSCSVSAGCDLASQPVRHGEWARFNNWASWIVAD